MIFVVSIIIFAILCSVWCGSEGTFQDGLLGGIAGCLLGVLFALCLWCFSAGAPMEVTSTQTYEIRAIADDPRYSGVVSRSVFMIQAKVDESLVYNYMYNEPGKGFSFGKVSAESSYINYTTDTPCVEINCYDYQSEFFRWLFPNPKDNEYIFYLPESAQIIDNYVIDFS